MNLEKLLTDSICNCTNNVFSTMLGQDLPSGEVTIETTAPGPNDGVASFIGIAGTWAGTGSINCSPNQACRICSLMLMVEASAVDADVLDAVAELTNMIIGGVKTDLENHLGQLGLSIPTVVYGRNFRTKSAGLHEWIVVTYSWDGEPFTVKLCLAPQERGVHLPSTAAHAYAIEV